MNLIKITILAAVIACMASCETDMQENIRQYIDKGETIYVGKVAGLYAFEGRNRIELIALLPYGSTQKECSVEITDANGNMTIKKYAIDDIKEEMTVIYQDGSEVLMNAIRIELNNLIEGVYNFKVQTFDKSGNSSLIVPIDGYSYGAVYEASLLNRKINSLGFDADGALVVKWAYNEKIVSTKLTYTNTIGELVTLTVLPEDTQTKITDSKPGSKLNWKTIYLPSLGALDEFESSGNETTIPLAEFQFDKSKFAAVVLPGDIQMGGWGMPISLAWNDNIYDRCHNVTDGLPLPYSLTIDLGRKAKLSRYIYWQFSGNYFGASNFEKWEVYGRADAPTDNSWAGWTLLRSCDNSKPSGLNNDQLADLARKGHEYGFDDTLPAVRYIRFKISNIFGGNQLFIGELTFYGLIE